MLEIKNITKCFGSFEALNNVSFTVEDGEIVGLLGENGAGKTTLLRIIGSILCPTKGEIFINGTNACELKSAAYNDIGLLFGNEAGLYERFTARENIMYFAELHGMNRKSISSRITYLSDKLDMNTFLDKRVSTFSKGMRQKVAIARAIIHNPNIILFDEPDSGLDFSSSKMVLDFLNSCARNNKMIIFSSHALENIIEICSKIVILHKGRVVNILDMSSLKKTYQFAELKECIFKTVCPDFNEGEHKDDE